MSDRPLFELLEETFHSQGHAAGFEQLIAKLLEAKNYPLLFEARLMQKRLAMELPLIFSGNISDLPVEQQNAYRAALVDAARETGQRFLADGDVVGAWPYFRAINEPAPIREAIERVEPGEGIDAVLAIALQEGVNPRRGLELLIAYRGICPGIDLVQICPDRAQSIEFLQILIPALYHDLAKNLKKAIAEVEGIAPESGQVAALVAGRDWLFTGGLFYIENSHLASLVQASRLLSDRETLQLAWELAEYALHLDPMFHVPGEAPFDHLHLDHSYYLGALLGKDVDAAVVHFRKKLAASIPGAAEALIQLLSLLGREEEAIQISIDHLGGQASGESPSAIQLCHRAGDYGRLRALARAQGDLLAFAAGIIAEG
ncbi:MAG TPA: hypothetical protein VG096_07875 [Bryobacteraceae bacterium]|jgi:hypothetical protein|nr:hypothetical protein [Bryobacteraceae bacterium]